MYVFVKNILILEKAQNCHRHTSFNNAFEYSVGTNLSNDGTEGEILLEVSNVPINALSNYGRLLFGL
jgi:hypothetical protein